jgi:hypothetical protein
MMRFYNACIPILLSLVLAISNSTGFSQSFAAHFTRTGPKSNGFWLYKPIGYDTATKNFPLIIFIHGAGQYGNGTSNIYSIVQTGLPMYLYYNNFPATFTVSGKTFSFLILCPQFTSQPGDADVDSLITYAIGTLKVDQTRIYLTGLSMGGGLTWYYSTLKDVNANRLAAVVPVSSDYQIGTTEGQRAAANHLPIYASHNRYDSLESDSITIRNVNFVNNSKPAPSPAAFDTIYQAVGHNAWDTTYYPKYKDKRTGLNIYQWMLQYTRSNPPPPPGPLPPPPPPPPPGPVPTGPFSYTDFEVYNSTLGGIPLVTIDWSTLNERNSVYFIVQRSPDGITFADLDSLPAANLASAHSYSFIDAVPMAGHDYYRIQQVCIDSLGALTGIKEVTISGPASQALKISPNPVSGSTLTLSMTSAVTGPLQVTLSDILGRTLKTWTFEKQTPWWQQTIEIGNIQPGNYFLILQGKDAPRQVKQFAKK